jgi:glycosyltransferase involved in cell wall biosynthesis
MLLIEKANGAVTTLEPESLERRNGAVGDEVLEERGGTAAHRQWLANVPPELDQDEVPRAEQPVLALFCYEGPGGDVTRFLDQLAGPLTSRGVTLHLFARKGFELDAPGALIHVLGDGGAGSLLDRVHEFCHRACNAFLKQLQGSPAPVTLMGCEWSTIPALSILRGVKNLPTILSLHSVERQRSDLGSEVSQRIDAIELSGLREARTVLTHSEATAALILAWAPDFAGHVVAARPMFSAEEFRTEIDAGAVKARYHIGPVDPLVLYIGDLSERYGPDMLLKAMPAVLKQHPQARLIVVGDGTLQWPLRVYARYLLLEHAVRLIGHIEGEALRQLVQAADVVVVPSRETTPWWPIQAAWAARRPVVATHQAAPGLLQHDRDAVLVYPETPSCAWGIERVLSDSALGRALAERGSDKLKERFGWDAVAAQVTEAMGAAAPRGDGPSAN